MRAGAGPPVVGGHDHDLAFVGAGASTAYVLLALLAGVSERPPAEPLRVLVVERNAEAFAGVPYGRRTAQNALLITKLRDFLPTGERRLLKSWLRERKAVAFAPFLATGGRCSQSWWERHQADVERDEYDDLFLPRYLFGMYLAERVEAAIALAARMGAAVVDVLCDEVLDVERAGEGYLLRCTTGVQTAGQVVLGVGSPPTRSRLPDEDPGLGAVLVDDPYADLEQALDRIGRALERAPRDRPPVVVLIGGNASTMDLLYQVCDLTVEAAERSHFVVVSPRGELPERMEVPNWTSTFRPEALAALLAGDAVDAEAIYRAAVADITRGRGAGLRVGDLLVPVSEAVQGLLPRLNAAESVQFAGRWGSELGRHLRRAGGEYADVVDRLVAQGRLHLVAGFFDGLSPAAGGTSNVRYRTSSARRELLEPVDLVINCGGADPQLLRSSDFLAARLVLDGVCALTPSGGGIAVDSDLAAGPGLFVMGPLLAGNVVDGSPIWHLEHCSRISSYGSGLGGRLAQALLAARAGGAPDLVRDAEDVKDQCG